MASDALNQVKTGFNNLGESSKTYERTLSEVNGTMSSAMSTAMRFAGIIAGGLTFNSAIQSAYSYNRTLEDTQLGLASLAYATMQFSDAQGNALTGQAAFNESLQFSSQFQDKLRIAGLQTAATFEQLATTVTQAWTPAVRAGFNPDQIISFTSATTQAATAMGINLNQMGEEIRSILTGTMTSMNTRLMPLMQSVGLTNEKLKELAKTGELYPAVMKAFEGATLAAEKANVSLGVSFSNLQDAGQSILGIGLKPFFDQLGMSARDLTSHIFTVKDGTIIWNKSLMELANSIGKAMGEAVKWTYEHVSAVIKWNDEHRELLKITGMVVAVLGSVLLAFKSLMFISSISALLNEFTASVSIAQASLFSLTTALGAVAAAFIGWQLGRHIGEMELFGQTVDTWTQLLYASIDNLLSDLGFKLADTFWYKPKEYFGKFIGEFVTWNQQLKQSIESIPLVGEAAGNALEAIGWDKQAESLRSYGQSVEDNARKSRYAHQESVEQDQQRINMTRQAILDEDKKGTAAEAASARAVNAKVKEIEGEQKKASEIKKMQNEQQRLHEKMWKEQTATVEDETRKQLLIAKHEYEQNVKAAKGNAQQLLDAEKTYQMQVASIKEKAKAEEGKRLQDIADKHREYRQIIEKNESQSLDNRLAANQKWYADELRELGAWAEKHKVTGRELDGFKAELEEARRLKEAEIRQEVAKKEEEAIKEKVKAWDKAYEQIQETMTGFLENGKLDMDSFAKAFKNMAANLVSSWMVNMARMSLPVWMGGYASSPTTALAANAGGSSGGATVMKFSEYLTGGWATKLGGYLSDNGASSVGEWFKNAGTNGIFSGSGGAGVTAGIATALIQGTMTGDWKKSFVSGIGTGLGAAIGSSILPGIGSVIGAAIGGAVANTASNTAIKYATYGSVLPGLGTSIGYIAGTIVGDKKDDANLFMSFGDPDKTVNQYDQFYGDPNKALYSPTGNGDWAYDPKQEWSVAESDVFAVDLRKGTYGISGDQIIKIENTVSDYFKNIFKTIDKTMGTSVKDFIRTSGIGLSINIENFQKYLKEGNIDAVIQNMTGQFFDAYGSAFASKVLNADASGLFTSEALISLQNSGETLGDTFARVAGFLQKVPEGVRRIREIMAEGLTEAEAFQKLEGQYEFVSGILGNALSEAMQQGVKAADFEAFKQTFATSLANQLKAAIITAFQAQILNDVIYSSFGSMSGFSDMLASVTSGRISISEFKTYMQTGMAAANAALEAAKPVMADLWDIIDLVPDSTDTAIEEAKAFAGDVVSGAISGALQAGVEAADWGTFRSSIESQLSAQLQTIVLSTFASNMINSVMSSVFSDGGGLSALVTDFMAGSVSAEQFSTTLGTLATRMADAADSFGPMFNAIIDAFNIQPKEDQSAETAADLASQPDAINDAVETFNRNQADASLMLAFINGLVEKIPDLVENYSLLDAALIRHKEGLIEYGSGLSDLTITLSGYVAEVKDLVNGLASAAGEASQKASDAAAAASAAAQSASESAKASSENSAILLGVLKNTRDTAAALDRLSPDGDALQVRTTE